MEDRALRLQQVLSRRREVRQSIETLRQEDADLAREEQLIRNPPVCWVGMVKLEYGETKFAVEPGTPDSNGLINIYRGNEDYYSVDMVPSQEVHQIQGTNHVSWVKVKITATESEARVFVESTLSDQN